jgi:mannosyltransferase
VAAVLAVGVLAAWLARHATRGVVVASVGVLLLMPSFSLYGQAARPYAVALAVAVLATVAWSRLVGYGAGPGGRPSAVVPPDGGPDLRLLALAGASYAAAVAALTLAHLLAVSLVAAHLVLAAVAPGELGRRRALLRTVAAAGAGLLPMLPFVAVAVANGKGPQTTPNFTPSGVGDVYLRLFVQPQAHIAGAAVLLAAAAVGMTRVRSRRHGAVARIAVAWALVPPVVLLPLFWARPSLIAHRYLVFVVPAWAMLGGLGLVTVAEMTQRAVRGAPVRGGSRRAGSAWRRTVVVAILAVTAVLQATALDGVRSPSSHGEDIRPALRAAGTGGREDLPLVVLSRGALEVATYSPDDEARLLGVHVQRRSGSIWPVKDTDALRPDRLRDQPRLVLLLRGRRHGPCRWRAGAEPTRFVTRCMPAAVRAYGYRVESATLEGHRWAVAVLIRPPVIPDVPQEVGSG